MSDTNRLVLIPKYIEMNFCWKADLCSSRRLKNRKPVMKKGQITMIVRRMIRSIVCTASEAFPKLPLMAR